jgi:hypothetical protein
MSYRVTFTAKSSYLHAVVTGTNSTENVARYLAEVRQECAGRGCSRVLIEERLEGARLDTMEVFRIVAQGSGRASGLFTAIAYVDVNADGDLMKFAETVGINRFLPLAVFSSVTEAEEWLLLQ